MCLVILAKVVAIDELGEDATVDGKVAKSRAPLTLASHRRATTVWRFS